MNIRSEVCAKNYRIQNKKKSPLNPKFLDQFIDGFEDERWDGKLCLIRPCKTPQSAYWIDASSVGEDGLKRHKNYRLMSLIYE